MFSQKFKATFLSALVLAWGLLGPAPARAADETAQVLMLRELFRTEQTQWMSTLEKHRGLLDASFFERCEARIRWALDNFHVEDAFRFAIVADFAAKLTGRPAMYRLELAEAAYKAGNVQLFDDIIQNVLVTDPGNLGALFLKCTSLMDKRQFAPAYETLRDLEAKNFNLPKVCYLMALIEISMGETQKAIEHLKKSGLPEALALLEKIQQQKDDLRFVPTSAGNPEAEKLFAEAERYLAMGDLMTAESLYTKTLQIDPKHKNAGKYLGAVFYRQRELAKAVDLLAQVVRLDSQDPEAWHFLGNALERTFDTSGDAASLQNAIKAYQEAARLEPNNAIIQGELLRAQSKLSPSAVQP
ncbi:MAG: CDC27 family protein [Candidatus Eremiobacterota bacterium]